MKERVVEYKVRFQVGQSRMNECLVTQLRLILCDYMDCSPQDFSAYGIFQAGILKWIAISTSRGSS